MTEMLLILTLTVIVLGVGYYDYRVCRAVAEANKLLVDLLIQHEQMFAALEEARKL